MAYCADPQPKGGGVFAHVRSKLRSHGIAHSLIAASLLVIVCACGSSTPTQTLSTPAGASGPPPPVTSVPPGTLPSGPPPSAAAGEAHADISLEALLPDDIDGVVLTKYSVTPDQFVGAGNEEPFATFLVAVGSVRQDVTLAVAMDPTGSVIGQMRALKVAGAQSDDLRAAVLADKAYADGGVSSASIGGKDVTVVTMRAAGSEFVDYLYVVDGVVFIVTGADAATAGRFLEALT
jgi:hypothetical protein